MHVCGLRQCLLSFVLLREANKGSPRVVEAMMAVGARLSLERRWDLHDVAFRPRVYCCTAVHMFLGMTQLQRSCSSSGSSSALPEPSFRPRGDRGNASYLGNLVIFVISCDTCLLYTSDAADE